MHPGLLLFSLPHYPLLLGQVLLLSPPALVLVLVGAHLPALNLQQRPQAPLPLLEFQLRTRNPGLSWLVAALFHLQPPRQREHFPLHSLVVVLLPPPPPPPLSPPLYPPLHPPLLSLAALLLHLARVCLCRYHHHLSLRLPLAQYPPPLPLQLLPNVVNAGFPRSQRVCTRPMSSDVPPQNPQGPHPA